MASQVGASQATVSRLERATDPNIDPPLIARIAKALGCSLADLMPEGMLEQVLSTDAEQFYAFCPDPFCPGNKYGWNAESNDVAVWWKSGSAYPMHRFDEINFCSKCGTALVKECPGCKRRLEQAGTRFCQTCGQRVTDRPTEKEWSTIRERVEAKRRESEENEIPF